MTAPNKAKIMEMMEKLGPGETLFFGLPPVFGGGVNLVGLNPLFPQKGEKKYQLRTGDSLEGARDAEPLITTDKAKKIAGWLADRQAFILEPLKKAS